MTEWLVYSDGQLLHRNDDPGAAVQRLREHGASGRIDRVDDGEVTQYAIVIGGRIQEIVAGEHRVYAG